MQEQNRQEELSWPFRPWRMYYISENDKMSAVFSQDHIIGWLCSVMESLQKTYTVKRPFTVVQMNPENNDELEILDVESLYERFSPVCGMLRKHGGGVNCKHYDNLVSRLFLGKRELEIYKWSKDQFKDEFNAAMRKYPKGCPCSLSEKDAYISFEAGSLEPKKHTYVKYHCPCTRMIELALPIYVDGVVVSVLLFGQLVFSDQVEEVNERLELIYRDLGMSEKPDVEPLLNVTFDDILSFVCKNLYDEEGHLDRRMSGNADSFMYQVAQQFHKTFAEESKTSFLQAAQAAVNEIMPMLSLEHGLLFVMGAKGLLNSQTGNAITFQGVQRTDMLRNPDCNTLDGIGCIPAYASCFPNELKNFSNDNSLLLTNHQQDEVPLALLLTPEHSVGEFSNSEIQRLMTLFSYISSTLHAGTLSAQSEKERREYDFALKSIGHDLGQFALSANGSILELEKLWSMLYNEIDQNYVWRFRGEHEKFMLHYKDANAFLKNIHILSESARLRAFSDKLKKRYYKIFGDTLYRLSDCFCAASRVKKMEIILPDVKDVQADGLHPDVYGDPVYIEQAAYNLIGNAVKYGHPGTCIYFDCCKADIDRDTPHVLSVTNYGPAVPLGELNKVFQMGFRSSATSEKVDGEGFGLFMVKRIAQKHAGDVICDCDAEPISKYNIPLIESYIYFLESQVSIDQKQKKLLGDLYTERNRLMKENIYQQVFNDNPICNFGFQTHEKNEELVRTHTYKVTFSMIIAPKHKQEEADSHVG